MVGRNARTDNALNAGRKKGKENWSRVQVGYTRTAAASYGNEKAQAKRINKRSRATGWCACFPKEISCQRHASDCLHVSSWLSVAEDKPKPKPWDPEEWKLPRNLGHVLSTVPHRKVGFGIVRPLNSCPGETHCVVQCDPGIRRPCGEGGKPIRAFGL